MFLLRVRTGVRPEPSAAATSLPPMFLLLLLILLVLLPLLLLLRAGLPLALWLPLALRDMGRGGGSGEMILKVPVEGEQASSSEDGSAATREENMGMSASRASLSEN